MGNKRACGHGKCVAGLGLGERMANGRIEKRSLGPESWCNSHQIGYYAFTGYQLAKRNIPIDLSSPLLCMAFNKQVSLSGNLMRE